MYASFTHTNFFFLKGSNYCFFWVCLVFYVFLLNSFPIIIKLSDNLYISSCIYTSIYTSSNIQFFFKYSSLFSSWVIWFLGALRGCHPRFLCIVLLGIPFPSLFVRSLVTWILCLYCSWFITLLVQCLQFHWGDREGIFLWDLVCLNISRIYSKS